MRRKTVFLTLTIAWMIFIFSFSARTGDASQQDSYRAGMFVGKMFVADFEQRSEAKQIAFAKKVDHPIRKAAHATEYAVLAMLIFGAYADFERKKGSVVWVPWMCATAYAATDEFHQLFVPGRSGQFTDVLIDSVGAAVGVGIIFLIFHMIKCKDLEKLYGCRVH